MTNPVNIVTKREWGGGGGLFFFFKRWDVTIRTMFSTKATKTHLPGNNMV